MSTSNKVLSGYAFVRVTFDGLLRRVASTGCFVGYFVRVASTGYFRRVASWVTSWVISYGLLLTGCFVCYFVRVTFDGLLRRVASISNSKHNISDKWYITIEWIHNYLLYKLTLKSGFYMAVMRK
jgi:hypothetical protein